MNAALQRFRLLVLLFTIVVVSLGSGVASVLAVVPAPLAEDREGTPASFHAVDGSDSPASSDDFFSDDSVDEIVTAKQPKSKSSLAWGVETFDPLILPRNDFVVPEGDHPVLDLAPAGVSAVWLIRGPPSGV